MAVIVVEQVEECHALFTGNDSQVFVLWVEVALFGDAHSIKMLAHLECLSIIYIAGSVCCEYSHLLAVGRERNVFQFSLQVDGGSHALVLHVDDLYLVCGASYKEESVRACIKTRCSLVYIEVLNLLCLAGGVDMNLLVRSHHIEEFGIWRIADGKRFEQLGGTYFSLSCILIDEAVYIYAVLIFLVVDEGVRCA